MIRLRTPFQVRPTLPEHLCVTVVEEVLPTLPSPPQRVGKSYPYRLWWLSLQLEFLGMHSPRQPNISDNRRVEFLRVIVPSQIFSRCHVGM